MVWNLQQQPLGKEIFATEVEWRVLQHQWHWLGENVFLFSVMPEQKAELSSEPTSQTLENPLGELGDLSTRGEYSTGELLQGEKNQLPVLEQGAQDPT